MVKVEHIQELKNGVVTRDYFDIHVKSIWGMIGNPRIEISPETLMELHRELTNVIYKLKCAPKLDSDKI